MMRQKWAEPLKPFYSGMEYVHTSIHIYIHTYTCIYVYIRKYIYILRSLQQQLGQAQGADMVTPAPSLELEPASSHELEPGGAEKGDGDTAQVHLSCVLILMPRVPHDGI